MVHIDPSLDYGRQLRFATQVLAGCNEDLYLVGELAQTHKHYNDLGHGDLLFIYAPDTNIGLDNILGHWVLVDSADSQKLYL